MNDTQATRTSPAARDAESDINCLFPVPDSFVGWPRDGEIARIVQVCIDNETSPLEERCDRLRAALSEIEEWQVSQEVLDIIDKALFEEAAPVDSA